MSPRPTIILVSITKLYYYQFDTGRGCKTMQCMDTIEASALRGVPVCIIPSEARTHFVDLQRDGQAELTWLTIPR